jgi:hypothetical protein
MSDTISIPRPAGRRLSALTLAIVIAFALAAAAAVFLLVTAIGDAAGSSPAPAPAIDADETTDSIVLTRWADCERQDDVATPC